MIVMGFSYIPYMNDEEFLACNTIATNSEESIILPKMISYFLNNKSDSKEN